MRTLSLVAVTIAVLLLARNAPAQSGGTQSESSSISTAPTAPAIDAEFSSFLPVTPGIKPPKATSAPDPKYPALPADAEPRGTVVMLIGVNAKGKVEAVRVLRSDQAAFEKSAVNTVKKWKFKPAEKDGKPVPVQITVEMHF